MVKKEKTLDTITETINKKYGDGTVVSGAKVTRDVPRVPTGILGVDLPTGGGFPIYRSSCVWGPESSGKTTLTVKAMIGAASICWRCFNYKFACKCGKAEVHKKSVFVDIEGTFDAAWAGTLGLTDDDYKYVSPDTGEDAVNHADQLIQADDCGLLIVDSLAMLEPSVELDASADDMQVGLQARLVSKMFRKLTSRIIQRRKDNNPVAVIFLNQVRAKIGGNTRFKGDPESQPGGYAARFAYSLSMRVGSRFINASKEPDKFNHRGSPIVVRSSIRINKHKVLALALTGEYDICKSSYMDYGPGTVLDVPSVITAAKEYGLLTQEKEGWVLRVNGGEGKTYRIQKDLIEVLKKSPKSLLLLKHIIIQRAKEIELAAMAAEDSSDDTVML